jgi:hypothetical protein
MSTTGTTSTSVFNGNLTCAHNNDQQINDDLEVLFIKHVPDSEIGIKISVAKDLYMASDFTNNPDKPAKKFAQEAIERAEAFCAVLKQRRLL